MLTTQVPTKNSTAETTKKKGKTNPLLPSEDEEIMIVTIKKT